MRLVTLVYTKEHVAALTGFRVRWVEILARERRLPVYSRKPLLFSVKEIDAWISPKNLQDYAEEKIGMFGGEDRPHPVHGWSPPFGRLSS